MVNPPQAPGPTGGFSSITKTFHSLRPNAPLPPQTTPFSVSSFAFSLLSPSPSSSPRPAFISAATRRCLSYSDFTRCVDSLSSSLQRSLQLSAGSTAFILSPNSDRLPVLVFSLLSIGVVVSPSNPAATESEIFRQIRISKPIIAFAASGAAHKLPAWLRTVIIDSPEFESLVIGPTLGFRAEPSQLDMAAILYSSGTSGKIKGVALTHRNLIALVANYHMMRQKRVAPAVMLYTVPFFHVYGFFHLIRSVAQGESVVVMERFELGAMLKAVEEFRVTHIAVAPPVVVAMVKANGCTMERRDLGSLETVICGGAPLGKDVIAAFAKKFPNVMLSQGYGLTETSGAAFRAASPEEASRWGSSGRLIGSCEAKVVDPDTGASLPPSETGEIWIRGPTVMKGYVEDPEATSATLTSDGWLKTGDLGYIDNEGFLFIVDRIKEVIKYKGYQVPPAELEQLLHSHPEILDAAVIPYPDEEAGQVPMAFVVRKPQSSIDELQIMDFVAKQVAPYKKIRRVAFVNSIPKNAGGKIMRIELRKMALLRSSSRL